MALLDRFFFFDISLNYIVSIMFHCTMRNFTFNLFVPSGIDIRMSVIRQFCENAIRFALSDCWIFGENFSLCIFSMDKQIDGLEEFLNPEPDFLTKIQNDYRTEKPRLLTLNSEFKFPATKVAAHLHVKPLYTRL